MSVLRLAYIQKARQISKTPINQSFGLEIPKPHDDKAIFLKGTKRTRQIVKRHQRWVKNEVMKFLELRKQERQKSHGDIFNNVSMDELSSAAPTTLDREWMVDSGASLVSISRNVVSDAEKKSVYGDKNSIMLRTVNGLVRKEDVFDIVLQHKRKTTRICCTERFPSRIIDGSAMHACGIHLPAISWEEPMLLYYRWKNANLRRP